MSPLLGNINSTGYTLSVIATEDNTLIQIEGEDYTIDNGKFLELDYPGKNTITII